MVAGLVAVATVGSAAAGAYVWHTAGIRSCAAQASLAGIWDESTRRAGRERFVATGRGYADHTWDTVSRTLDAYASELSAQQRAACRAAASWSDEDPTTSARWTLCLDRRRERLRALTGLFAAADARVVDHAVEALGALPPIADCATPGTAENVLDDAARQRLAEIETELLRAATLRKAARYDEAAKAGHKALEAAREVGDRATEARARIELGRIALHTDESSHEDAERELHAALALAESIGDVETAVRALTMLVHTVGPVAGRYAEADRLADQAQAKLEFGRLGPALEGELAYEIGLLRYREHRFEDALAAYEDARRLQAHAHGPRHPSVARSLTEIGNVHVQQSRYSAAAPMFEQAMQIYAEQLGEEHPRANSARNGLAMIARHAGDLERSLALFTEILHVQRRTEGEMHLGNAVTLSNRSSVMQRLGREDEALADLDRALQIRDRALGEEHPAVARTLTNRAGLLGRLGRAEEAIPDLERASAIFERTLGEDSPALAITLATLGELHVASGRIDQGEQAYERAIEIIRAQRTADFQTLGQTYAMLGTGLIERGLRDRGMAALEQAIDAFERHDDSAVYLAAARFRLAQTLWATDRRRARHLATRAHRVLAANEHDREDAQEVEAWLRAHGGTLGIEG